MGDLAISKDELQTLLEITNDLTVTAEGAQCILDKVTAQIGTLVPFDRFVLLHERARERGSITLIYERLDACDTAAAPETRCVEDLNISRHLEQLEKTETFQNAFYWRSTGRQAQRSDREIGELSRLARAGEGVAGTVSSVDHKSGRLATLLQMELTDGQFVSKHLFFANMVIFYLHVYLTHRAAGIGTSGTRQSLTCKEREVLHWIVEGKTAWEVGRILSMSERTVKFHLRNIYSKLNVANRAQAVTKASRLRLI
jgi:LuxR family quorum-sensing system transcriptional regulator SolR